MPLHWSVSRGAGDGRGRIHLGGRAGDSMLKRRCSSHHWFRFAVTALAFAAVAIPASGEPATFVSVVARSLDAQVFQVRPSADGQRVLLGGSFGLVSVDVARRDVSHVAPSSTGLAGIQAWAQSSTGS